ncbi:MAG TPA: histone deacetylase [Thermoanaerobaculia bacterium]|jgi:acetoin utilization deacetylase AcuC-like enzyme|nr:histone deacetylase [Thermoanaerobaculia bacterium]
MKAFYTDHFVLPLPEGHRFPMAKYSLLRERVTSAGFVAPEELLVPEAATDEQLALAHDAEYVARVVGGRLDRLEIRRIGFPWSEAMVERSRRSAGATIAAARAALESPEEDGGGVAVNLAGGTHHAMPARGEGYCVWNDSGVAARLLLAEGRIRRAIVIDCDVHQGNGTAAIFRDDPSVFTFSIHSRNNFPFHKETSDLDLELADRTGDEEYLRLLEEGLERALGAANADLAFYVSGADPHERDRLGRISVTFAGLGERDRMVFAKCREAGVPVAVSMAGGYGQVIAETVSIHAQTVALAAESWREGRNGREPREGRESL